MDDVATNIGDSELVAKDIVPENLDGLGSGEIFKIITKSLDDAIASLTELRKTPLTQNQKNEIKKSYSARGEILKTAAGRIQKIYPNDNAEERKNAEDTLKKETITYLSQTGGKISRLGKIVEKLTK